jgi:hypothetical protein
MNNKLFTHSSTRDGNFGVGKIPLELQGYTSDVGELFYKTIPENKKKDMTYHVWYNDFSPDLKDVVKKIQKHPFWKQVCNAHDTCVLRNISEMDELYYSRAPKQGNKGILYGATGNYDLHVDGVLNLPGIKFYRILIGLTNNNNTVVTAFPRLKSSLKINKDDYVVFDFDKAQHRVINEGDDNNFRMLLKLHFCVCETCKSHTYYFDFACKLYVFYEIVTRYIMQTGTNPETWYQFFLGLLAYTGANLTYILGIFVSLLILYLVLLITKTPLASYVGLLVLCLFYVFNVIVTLFWLRYKLFRIR